jgi:DNA modification methylase
VAARLGRTFVGIDKSEVALEIATNRLEAGGIRFAAQGPGIARLESKSA